MDEHPTTTLAREIVERADKPLTPARSPVADVVTFLNTVALARRLLALEAVVEAAWANDAAYTEWSRTNFSDIELRAAHARAQVKLYSTLAALDRLKEGR